MTPFAREIMSDIKAALEAMPERQADELALQLREIYRGRREEMSQDENRVITALSEDSFADWGNEKDAAYDNWQEQPNDLGRNSPT